MTRERCKELLPIMQAFAEGKQIQWRYFSRNDEWKDTEKPCFDGDGTEIEYRIKPPTKKYRPYKDCEEMIQDFYKKYLISETDYDLPLIWVKGKNEVGRCLIVKFGLSTVDIVNKNLTLENLFTYFTYLDGSPIGVRV